MSETKHWCTIHQGKGTYWEGDGYCVYCKKESMTTKPTINTVIEEFDREFKGKLEDGRTIYTLTPKEVKLFIKNSLTTLIQSMDVEISDSKKLKEGIVFQNGFIYALDLLEEEKGRVLGKEGEV